MSEPSFLEVVGEVHNILYSFGTIPGVLSLTIDDVNGDFLVGFHNDLVDIHIEAKPILRAREIAASSILRMEGSFSKGKQRVARRVPKKTTKSKSPNQLIEIEKGAKADTFRTHLLSLKQ